MFSYADLIMPDLQKNVWQILHDIFCVQSDNYTSSLSEHNSTNISSCS